MVIRIGSKNEGVSSHVLIVTMHATEEYAVRLFQAGARGFVGKGTPSQEMIHAIRKVAAGDRYVPSAFADAIAKRYVRKGTTDTSPVEALSDRELQVLKHVAEGLASHAIAQHLYMSPKLSNIIAPDYLRNCN